jgi:hypothetical protein
MLVSCKRQRITGSILEEGHISFSTQKRTTAATKSCELDPRKPTMWRHLAQTGDFESMLLLVSPKLKNLPAMKVESLQSFVRRK